MTVPSLVNLLSEQAEKLPDRRSYTFLSSGEESESLTFSELFLRARAIGAHLQALRARGERALLVYPPGMDYLTGFYGCVAAGAVAVPAYPPRMNRNFQRLESIVADARPKVVLTTEAVHRHMLAAMEDSPNLARVDWVLTDQIDLGEAAAWTHPQSTADTVAVLQYTSASTAQPKGVIVSHGNILHNQALMKVACRHESDSVIVSWQPVFHDMGLVGVVLASLYNGIPGYLMSPVEFLKRPRAWLEAVTRYGGTFSGAPDFGYRLCVDRIGPAERVGLDLSSWRVAFNGAEPVRADTIQSFIRAFEPVGFCAGAMFPCYGLAEHTLYVTGGFSHEPVSFSRESLETNRPRLSAEDQSSPLISCGETVADSKLVIADTESLRPCPEGQIGEIWLSSPSVAKGYWNQPELTARDFQARLVGSDEAYLRTGDLGFVHGGELFVTGRLKDLIIIRGRNIIPQDIEQTVESCGSAIQPGGVAAVSLEAGGGEVLVIAAEVRRENRRSFDAQTLFERIRSQVATEHAVEVAAVILLKPGKLPKTSSGKTQRSKVSQAFLAGELGELDQWRDDEIFGETKPKRQPAVKRWMPGQVEAWVIERIARLAKLPQDRISGNHSISFYGLDSMAAVRLVCELEENFGIPWDLDRLFDGDPTVRELAQRVLLAISAATAAGGRAVAPIVGAPFRNSLPPTAQPSANGNGKSVSGPLSQAAAGFPKAVEPLRINGGNGSNGTSPPPALSNGNAKSHQVGFAARRNGHKPEKPERQHPFRSKVNPELGRLLHQMSMDKTFVRGEGSWLWDEDGRRYLDFLAQYGALPFGFNPPRIWAAIERVRESGEPSFIQPSYLNAAGELAERLLAAAPPGMAYSTFGNSGAEAVEAAIKLARSTTRRNAILSASNGFHGKTLGALSATDKEKYQKHFGAPVAEFDYVPYGNIDALRRALATHRYAGFIVEPVQGEGGIVEPPAGYLRSARKACREVGTLFIADEIQTGIGRTGAMFVCCEMGITPDIMTVAKALGGGLIPIGACLATAEAYNEDFALKHTSTFAGNTLACRVGLATLDLLEENNGALIRHVAETGARLKEGLLELQRRFPDLIAEVRGRGFLLGLRFGLNRHSVKDGLLGYLGEQDEFTYLVVGHLLHFEGVRVGCTLNQGGILRIEPPLIATWEECHYFLQALERILRILKSRDIARLTAQISGISLPPAAAEVDVAGEDQAEAEVSITEARPVGPQPDDGRFAFLVHPLAWKDYSDLDATLSPLSDGQLATLSSAIADNFDPFVIGETRIVAKNGKAAYGEFILVPRRAEELKAMPQPEVLAEIQKAVELGKKRGAKIVGLGAYTSIATQGGLSLKGLGLPALTTGNSYTAVAARETVRLAAAERGWTLPMRTVAVLGAGGAIGQALSILLARDVGRLILLGNPAHPQDSRQRLLQVAGRIVASVEELSNGTVLPQGSIASWVAERKFRVPANPDRAAFMRLGEELIGRTGPVIVSVDAEALMPEADVIVCCTSSTEQLVTGRSLGRDAVVCDVSRPSNVTVDAGRGRPDVMILNGGVVRLPGDSPLGVNASLPYGHAYACMAETMMLALEERYVDTSLGFDLPLSRVLELEQLAAKFDFQVALDHKERNDKAEFSDVAESLVSHAAASSVWA